jgi:hypothetical protein
MEPIMNRFNFKDYLKAVDNEKDQDFIPTNAIQRPLKAFDEWVNENQERAKGWVNMPYFIRDNPQFVKTRFNVNTQRSQGLQVRGRKDLRGR